MKITSTGVGSGIDIRELVDNLLEAESKDKIKKFDHDEATTLAKITGYGTLKSAMSSFVDKIDNLKDINQFELRSANATLANDEIIITPYASAQASAGNYSIEVTQLALSQKSASIPFAENYTVIGTGTLTFTTQNAQYSFQIDNTNSTLQGINDTINSQAATTGISSSLIVTDAGTKIVFTSPTGTNNAFTVSVSNDGDGNNTNATGLSQLASPNLTLVQAPVNAAVKIDGVTVNSESNTLKYAIKGVTFDLVNTNVGKPITLSVDVDVQSAHQAITDFVNSYNEVFDSISKLTQYDNDSSKENMGVLIGDSTLRNIEFQLRRILTDIVQSQPAGFATLSQIGISSDIYTGKLIINDYQLTDALENNFTAVGNLFMQEKTGVLDQMEAVLDNYIEVNGILQTKQEGLRKSIDVINDQRLNLERHLISLEKRLLVQFTAMDSIVSRLKSLSDFLETQLEKLPEPLMFRK
ncbi:MAG: flagellar filament capping protein FliD [Proteobacteria bacterium]|nr:flagellar filament capping protein FliD [Pseudomonadota bacterium]